MKTKETKTANVLRILGGILMAFSLFALINSIIAEYMIFNPYYWRDYLFGDEARDIMFSDPGSNGIVDLDLGEDGNRELGNVLFDIAFDVMDSGDYEIDEDWVDDFYDEYVKDVDNGEYSRKGFEQALEAKAEEIKSDVNDSDLRKVIDVARDGAMTVLCISLGVTVLIMAVLIWIHRNKFRPVRTFGASLGWAGALSLPLWGLMKAIMSELEDDPDDPLWGLKAIKAANNSVVMIIVICVIVLVVGIVIVSMSKKAIDMNDENLSDDPYDDDDYDRRMSDYE